MENIIVRLQMVDGYRRLLEASPPSTAKSLLKKNRSAFSAHNMLLGFIAGISTVMVLALLYYLFWRKVIPFLKQRKTLKGEMHLYTSM